MIYTFKDCKILINNRELVINRANLLSQAFLDPNFTTEGAQTTQYRATNGLEGTLSLSYYLTGADFLRRLVGEERTPIQAYVGGFQFNSGYIRSYGMRIVPNEPIETNVEIVFLEKLKGNFVANTPSKSTYTFLNGGDITLSSSSFSSFGSNLIDTFELNYSLSQDIEPNFLPINFDDSITEINPVNVCFGKSSCSLDLSYTTITGGLIFEGQTADVSITLRDVGSAPKETINISGVIYKREIDIVNQEIIKHYLGIQQSSVVLAPEIYSINPATGFWDDSLLITGNNLFYTQSVSVNNIPASFTVLSDEELEFHIPETYNGKVKIVALGGTIYSTGNLIITAQERSLNMTLLNTPSYGVGELP